MKKKNKKQPQLAATETSTLAAPTTPRVFPANITVFVVAALVTMTLFLNGDVNYHAGDHQIVNILWMFAAAVMLFFARNRRDIPKPFRFSREKTRADQRIRGLDEAEGCRPYRLRYKPFRWQWVDTCVAVFFLWIFASFCVIHLLKQGSFRPSLTLLTQWGGFAGMYFVFRAFLTDNKRVLGILLVCFGLVFAETVISFYQYGYEMPQSRAEYFADPEPFLQANQITTDMEREAFENRLKGTEPIGTYSLTNSLAGVLVPWLIVVFGLAVVRISKKVDPGSIVLLVAMFVPLAACLFLTRSRSGWLAALFGLVAVALLPLLNRTYRKISLKKGLLFGSVLLAFLILGGLAALSKGGLVDGAIRSFGFRLQYWQSSLMMMGDRPLFGCGVGNFRQFYTQYKLPEASEIIADPHNFLMEIGTNAGIPALLIFLAIFLVGFFRKTSEQVSFPRSQIAAREIGAVREKFFSMLPYIFGGLAGMVFAFGESKLCVAEILLPHLLLGIVGFHVGAALCMMFFLKNNVTDIPTSVVKIAMLSLLVNLLAAGGIAYPHVSLSLWLFLAICLNRGSDSLSPPSNRQKRIPIIAAVVLAVSGFLGYGYAFSPNLQAQLKYREFQFMAPSRPIDLNTRTLEDVLRIDPHFTQARLELFHYYVIERQHSRNPSAWVWTPKIDEAMQKAITSSPRSAPIRESLGDILVNDYLQTGRRESLDQAIDRYEELVTLYPNGAVGYAKLSQARLLEGNYARSQTAARKAIELDDIMPHQDKKLPSELRAVVEKAVKMNQEKSS